MTSPLLELIQSCLGPTLEKVPFRIAGRDGIAYRAPARSHGVPHTWADVKAAKTPLDLEREAVAADPELRACDVRHFLGIGGTVLYAIPGLHPLDVVEFARVGTHERSEHGWKDVRQLLLETVHTVGFDVVFADEAGLDVRFERPVATATAIAWDRLLLDRIEAGATHWMDSYTSMLDRGLKLDPVPGADARGGGGVPAFILATQSLRLWWD